MTGDFLDLLPKTPFPNVTGEGRKLEGLEATTVFAFHCADGVLIGGDHRATAGHAIFSDRTEKILELDSHSLMAIAGVPAMAFEMARTLQTAFEFYRRSQLQAMSLAAKVRALSRLLRENLPATLQGVGAVSPVFAGVESVDEHAKPVIYFYDPLGAHFEAAAYAASGSGSNTIKSVLHYLENWGHPHPAEMSLQEAVVLANRLLMTAAEFDAATGGVHAEQQEFATIKLLSAKGIRSISTQEQTGFWKDARP
ncbi:MAG TPA: proteasome subunit alpha [Verrucomicrobiae bacterium]|nr:proteasome subunit alpha [Verrucomicrobiae bacterium]